MDIKRAPIFVVKDLETLKVLTDPLRMQILELLDPEPQTVNQVAEKLGLSSNRLYYHFNLLEKVGLIQVTHTRQINNMLENFYWVTAEDIDIEKDLLNFSSETGQENVYQMISSKLEATREDILRSVQARKIDLNQGGEPNPREMVMANSKKRLKDETYQDFINRLKDLIKEFCELPEDHESSKNVNVYALTCFLYPSYTYESLHGEESEGA